MWPSAQAWNWNAVDIGPKQDLLASIMAAVRQRGLKAGLYFSLYEWFHPLYTGSDPSQYVEQVMVPQWYDLIKSYQPDILWCDGEWDHNSAFWTSTQFLSWVFNESPVKDTIAINDRFGSETRAVNGGFYTPEYSPQVNLTHKWEENSGIDIHSYGFNRNTPADAYYTADYLIKLLVRCVANNGNLLLDIGPSHDGSIPTVMQLRLLEMGDWLSVNGEAIYSSRIWRVQQEGPIDNTTTRYTYQPSTQAVYAILLEWPLNFIVTLPSPISTQSTTVQLLGWPDVLSWKSSSSGLIVNLPVVPPSTSSSSPVSVWVLKLTNVK